MKLDCNTNSCGKYAVVNMRKVRKLLDTYQGEESRLAKALQVLESLGVIEYGEPNSPDEFFVLKLKDRYAHDALMQYSWSVNMFDPEYAEDIKELAYRAGYRNRYCKDPD